MNFSVGFQPSYPGQAPQQGGYGQFQVSAGPVPSYPPDRAAERPMFFIQSQHNPELVLDVEGGSSQKGAKLILWQRKQVDYANQLFTFTPEGFIENVKSGLVVDIEGEGGAGSKICVWEKKPAHQAANQRWQYDYGDQTFHSLHKGLVLDVEGGSRSPGTKIIAWNFKPRDNSNQRFTLIPATLPVVAAVYSPSPVYAQPVGQPYGQPYPQPGGQPYGQPAFTATFSQPSFSPAFSPPVVIAQPIYSGGIQPSGPSFGQAFFIQSTWNDLVLDVEGGNTSPGAHVILWPKKGRHEAQNQLWRFTPDGYIESAQTGLVLDVKGGGGPGTHIIVWNKKPGSDAANQRWNFDSGRGIIVGQNGVVFDIEGGNRNQGTKLCIWHAKGQHENHNQRWRLLPQ